MRKITGGISVWWVLVLPAACSGVEPEFGDPGPGGGAEGGSGVYVHGSAACGNLGGALGMAGAGGAGGGGSGSSSLPTGFGGQGATAGTDVASAAGGSGGSSGGAPAGSGGAAEPGGAAGSPTEPLGHQLLLTEYVEGSSSYKALEITALADSTFEGCRVAVYFNGASSATGITLEGQLGRDESYVLCTSSLAGVGAACDRTTNLAFNGDDAVALECGGAVVDVIGQIGADPGAAWSGGDVTTLDRTLRRDCTVVSADTDPSDPFDPSLEWQGFPQDTFDDLKQRDCSNDGEGGASDGSSP